MEWRKIDVLNYYKIFILIVKLIPIKFYQKPSKLKANIDLNQYLKWEKSD